VPQQSNLNEKVETWWNENPFTHNGIYGVGHFPLDKADLKFFEKVEKRFRRHSPERQKPGTPILSNFIDYQTIRGEKILDIACGTGFLTVEFARQGCEATAIDLTEYAVEATQKNLQLRGLNGTVLKMDAQQLEFPDNTFSFVSAHGCLMHMPDTERAIAEIRRVLKPGGGVYAWMYNKGWYYWFNIIILRGILLGGFLRHGFSSLALTSRYTDGIHMEGNPHTKFYSAQEIKKMFSDAGFSYVKTEVLYNPSHIDAWPVARLPLGKYLPEAVRKALGKIGLGIRIEARK